MSAWSTQRKINLLLTFFVVASFAVSSIIFVIYYNPVTCDDGIRNGLEVGVDCGGACPNACPETPKKLLDLWTRYFPVVNGIYSAVAYIENQNSDLYVPSVQYEILLYDKNGSVISRHSEKTSIMPNSITPIFVSAILTGESKVAGASFRFVNESVFVPKPNDAAFSVSDIATHVPERGAPRVSATVRNIGSETVPEVDFVVIVYDEGGVAIAASRTFETYVNPNEERHLEFSWIHPFTLRRDTCPGGTCLQQVKKIEIIPVIRRW